MKKACLLLVVVLLPMVLDAQSFYRRRRDRSFIASFGTGLASYFGELANPGDYIDTKLNMEFGLEYKFHPRITPKIGITYFRLEGNDNEDNSGNRINRNLSFRSDNIELSTVLKFQVFEENSRYYQRPAYNFYGFAGFGILWYNPRAIVPEIGWDGNPLPDAGKYVSLRQYRTELVDYKSFGFVIPVGFGFVYKATPWFNVAIDGAYRFTFTDYLDDISTTYPGIDKFSDPVAAALSDRRIELDQPAWPEGHIRGNPDSNDGYFLWNIKVEYYLPSLFGASTGSPRRGSGRRR